MFEPIHGTAPKYADQNVVNPIAALIAAKMMMDYLGEREVGLKSEQAISGVLAERRVMTYDLGGKSSSTEVAQAIAEHNIRTDW